MINLTIVGLQKEFSRVEKDFKSVVTESNELKASVISLNKDVEGKTNFEKSNQEHDKEINMLRLKCFLIMKSINAGKICVSMV